MNIERKQCLLKYLGYYNGAVDGIWGAGSEQAVRELQAASGLQVDGIFGDATLAAAKHAVAQDLFRERNEEERQLALRFQGIRYWTPAEFKCQCGGRYCNGFPVLPSRELLELADDLRERAGSAAIRSSGLRCPAWNAHEGGVANSRHMQGKALDFCVPGMTGSELLALALADSRTRFAYQIKDANGNLTPYIHVDVV